MRSRIARGYTMVELLVSMIVFGVLMSALYVAFIGMWKQQTKSIGFAASQQSAEQVAYSLVNAFRGATNCTSTDSGCTVGAPIESASSTGCTIYSRDSSNNLVETTYAMSGTNFQMTTGSTTTVLATGATVTLTYYQSTTYYTTSLSSYTPTSTTAGNLIAVGIAVTDAQSGGSNTYTTLVRLRNSP